MADVLRRCTGRLLGEALVLGGHHTSAIKEGHETLSTSCRWGTQDFNPQGNGGSRSLARNVTRFGGMESSCAKGSGNSRGVGRGGCRPRRGPTGRCSASSRREVPRCGPLAELLAFVA